MQPTIQFSNIDIHPEALAQLNHQDLLNANPSIIKQKEKTFHLMSINEGDVVLDAGCGLGDDAHSLLDFVGEHGRVYGISNSKVMLDCARERFKKDNLLFQQQDIRSLNYADNFFDSIRADRVLMHLSDPRAAISELIRILKPNGRLVINEPDLTSFIFSPYLCSTKLNMEYINHLVSLTPSPRIGFELKDLFLSFLELSEISMTPTVLEFYESEQCADIFFLEHTLLAMMENKKITQKESDDWLQNMRTRTHKNRLSVTANQFAVQGRKRARC